MRHLRFALLFAFALGCGGPPEAGTPCESQEQVCASDHTAWYCYEHQWTVIQCRGSRGCNQGLCDQTSGEVGEVCNAPNVPAGACQTDGRAKLVCGASVFKKVEDCANCFMNSSGSQDCQQ